MVLTDGIEFIPGEDTDALAGMEILEGHEESLRSYCMGTVTGGTGDGVGNENCSRFGLGLGCPGVGLTVKDLHFIGDGSDDVIQRDTLAGGLTAPVGFAPAIKNDFAAGFELFAKPVGDRPPFKDFGRGDIKVIIFIVVIDSAAIPADMNGFGLAAGAGLGKSRIGEAANGAEVGFYGIRVVRIVIRVLEFGIIEVRDVNFIKAAGRTAFGAGLEGSITKCGFIIGFIEGRSFRDISAGSEGGKDKIHFLIHITEDFAVDKLIENFLVGCGIGGIFVTVDGVKHEINFLFCM